MSLAIAHNVESEISLRSTGKTGRFALVAGLIATLVALAPFAVAAFGIARGGIEPYIVLAALALG